jgi:hypothetical protein
MQMYRVPFLVGWLAVALIGGALIEGINVRPHCALREYYESVDYLTLMGHLEKTPIEASDTTFISFLKKDKKDKKYKTPIWKRVAFWLSITGDKTTPTILGAFSVNDLLALNFYSEESCTKEYLKFHRDRCAEISQLAVISKASSAVKLNLKAYCTATLIKTEQWCQWYMESILPEILISDPKKQLSDFHKTYLRLAKSFEGEYYFDHEDIVRLALYEWTEGQELRRACLTIREKLEVLYGFDNPATIDLKQEGLRTYYNLCQFILEYPA